jgi:hypothetical protein
VVEEFALQNLTQTRASIGCVGRPYVPRALLQIFITNTFNHRFAKTWCATVGCQRFVVKVMGRLAGV